MSFLLACMFGQILQGCYDSCVALIIHAELSGRVFLGHVFRAERTCISRSALFYSIKFP